MNLPDGWDKGRLGATCSIEIGGTPTRDVPEYWDLARETDNAWVSIKDMRRHVITETAEHISDAGVKHSNVKLQPPGTVLLSFKLTIGRVAMAGIPLYTNEAIAGLKPRGLLPEYLYHGLQHWDLLQGVDQAIKGATLNKEKLKRITFEYPRAEVEQAKIAQILSTVDRAIEQTKALITKQQRIKTGLMQDLLTRGIDEHGNLRSEQTHEFKNSPLGRIPAEWEVKPLGELVVSAVDGPFGSNLKTDHYVDEPGVRVIRLQNLGNGEFVDADKVWVSREHARRLERHSVTSGDLLIGSLGDDKRLFGRACLYPESEQPAIVKADVFRVRCKKEVMVHGFAFRLFNLPRWRSGLFGLAQGVTRDRVNLSNLMLFELPVPSAEEQRLSASYLDTVGEHLVELQRTLKKLRSLKTALMQDLLTGKRRVTALLPQPEARA